MFECNRCREPYYLQRLEVRGRDARLGLRCVNGHKGSRKITLDQVNSISEELFNGVYVCVECGSVMTLLKKKMSKSSVEIVFVCPNHGPQIRVIDYRYQAQIDDAKERVNSRDSIIDSMNCPRCAQPLAINEIGEKQDILYVRGKCSNGHSRTLRLANTTDDETMKQVLQHVVKCDNCGLTGKLTELEKKGKSAAVKMICPAHGDRRKTIPLSLFALQRDAVSELSRDKLVHSMFICGDCKSPLAIRSIEHDKKGYELKCVCKNGHNSEMTMPLDWGKESIDSVVNSLLKCKECDLLTHIVESKVGKKLVDIEIVCPIHETQKKGVAIDVYKHMEARADDIDRSSSLESSLKCAKCDTALRIRDLKRKDGYIDFGMDCRNGHRTTRYFANDMDPGTLVLIYTQAFECPRCHSSMELTNTESEKDDFVATLHCATHGETEFKIPHEHELAMKEAYLSTLTLDKLEILSVERFQIKTDCEFTIDDESDLSEMIQLTAGVIDEQNVRFVAEKKTNEGTNEVWYVGMTEEGDDFLVIGSVSTDNNLLSISVKAANEDQISGIFNDLRDRMRDILIRRQKVSEDSSPIIIMCPHCKGALEEKALPGESMECPHCGVTLHW